MRGRGVGGKVTKFIYSFATPPSFFSKGSILLFNGIRSNNDPFQILSLVLWIRWFSCFVWFCTCLCVRCKTRACVNLQPWAGLRSGAVFEPLPSGVLLLILVRGEDGQDDTAHVLGLRILKLSAVKCSPSEGDYPGINPVLHLLQHDLIHSPRGITVKRWHYRNIESMFNQDVVSYWAH